MTGKIIALLAMSLTLGSSLPMFNADSTASTDVTISMKSGEAVAPDPGDNDGGTGPGSGSSNFQIWKFPTVFGFKSVAYNANQDMVARVDTSIANNPEVKPLTVVDVRGTGTGWRLSASLPKLQDVSGVHADITNMELTFRPEVGHWEIDPTGGTNHTWIKGGLGTDVVAQSTSIKNTPSVILSAENGKGKGYQGIMLNDIKLTIKAGQGQEGVTYKGTINWSLDDTPGA